jgi:hypothetical protein
VIHGRQQGKGKVRDLSPPLDFWKNIKIEKEKEIYKILILRMESVNKNIIQP